MASCKLLLLCVCATEYRSEKNKRRRDRGVKKQKLHVSVVVTPLPHWFVVNRTCDDRSNFIRKKELPKTKLCFLFFFVFYSTNILFLNKPNAITFTRRTLKKKKRANHRRPRANILHVGFVHYPTYPLFLLAFTPSIFEKRERKRKKTFIFLYSVLFRVLLVFLCFFAISH